MKISGAVGDDLYYLGLLVAMVDQYNCLRWSLNEENGVITITLDRPDSMNSLSPELRKELSHGLEQSTEIDRDPEKQNIAAVVVKGAGDQAFSVGADINVDEELDPAVKELRKEIIKLSKIQMPVIASIDGYCLGGGLEFALACDFRIATQDSELGFPESHLGILPANGGIQRLTSQTGPSRAKELVMSGDRISAEQAKTDRIVDYVCDREEIDEFVEDFVDRICTGAPLAIRAAKDIVDAGVGTNLETAIAYEHRASRVLRTTCDYREGRRSFEEDRTPEWRGE